MSWHVYTAVAASELATASARGATGQPAEAAAASGGREQWLALHGIDDAPVRLLPAGAVALAASEHATAPAPTAASLMAHARVAMQLGGVPFRFGAGAPSPHELQAQVASRAAALAQQLDVVGDCLEMVVRLPRAQEDRSSGKAYLSAKKRAAEATETLERRLAPAVRDYKQLGGRLLCLVPRERLSDFQRLAEDEDVSGPWPPSSFV